MPTAILADGELNRSSFGAILDANNNEFETRSARKHYKTEILERNEQCTIDFWSKLQHFSNKEPLIRFAKSVLLSNFSFGIVALSSVQLATTF